MHTHLQINKKKWNKLVFRREKLERKKERARENERQKERYLVVAILLHTVVNACIISAAPWIFRNK